jgi:hypothetical protein
MLNFPNLMHTWKDRVLPGMPVYPPFLKMQDHLVLIRRHAILMLTPDHSMQSSFSTQPTDMICFYLRSNFVRSVIKHQNLNS